MDGITELKSSDSLKLIDMKEEVWQALGALLLVSLVDITCLVLAYIANAPIEFLIICVTSGFTYFIPIWVIFNRRSRATHIRNRIKTYKYSVLLINAYRKFNCLHSSSKSDNKNLPWREKQERLCCRSCFSADPPLPHSATGGRSGRSGPRCF